MLGKKRDILLNRLHGGQPGKAISRPLPCLLNRLHGGQLGSGCAPAVVTLLNRLHGGQLERYETISLSFKGLHLGTSNSFVRIASF